MFNFGGSIWNTQGKIGERNDRQILKESSLLIENKLQKRNSDS